MAWPLCPLVVFFFLSIHIIMICVIQNKNGKSAHNSCTHFVLIKRHFRLPFAISLFIVRHIYLFFFCAVPGEIHLIIIMIIICRVICMQTAHMCVRIILIYSFINEEDMTELWLHYNDPHQRSFMGTHL